MDALRAMWKGTISFGLVTIPVKLYAATESKDLRFNLLHEPCQTPVQYRKYCPTCEREVESGEIVKGYEFDRGRYVTLRDEDFESIPLAARRTLEIVAFVRLEEIDPIYFDKTYYLEPGEGGAKAYGLLRHAMEVTGRVAIARVVLRAKESLAALRVFREGVLAMETMHFPDEVRPVAALTGIAQPELRPQEIEMATGLIESLTMPFSPERFENTYREALLELIQAKIAGAPPAEPGPAPEQGRVVDLMEALRASIRAAEAQRAAGGATGGAAGADGTPPAPVARSPEAPARRAIPGLPGDPAASVPGVPAAPVPRAPGVTGAPTPGTPPAAVPGVPATAVPGTPGAPVPTAPGVPSAPAPGTSPTSVPGVQTAPNGAAPPGPFAGSDRAAEVGPDETAPGGP
ncbi:Ku protein [Symbiobacterium thermophilum]|uniref:Non-homologous end joining protein Ku n=1 Tax=Symbiobacterium thermophilum (strain DSM 24528 / JCM 14929 / IAM 14863 / T) TaxID=292459 RepID=KU_SYMTH|nr:Ku protein [Symbiobacterium thermophilum]Q67NG0.1 RecName: Full=Non-homologous end joining protein Ku [Symbiobacterium thermophilum IAM 14863]BAD40783.1 conserved hypothetical protein [Symbiobacterium thermophilum IAM 14863]